MSTRKPPVAVYETADGPALTAYGVALLRVIALPSVRPEWVAFEDATFALGIDWAEGNAEFRLCGMVTEPYVVTPAGLALLAELGVEVVK